MDIRILAIESSCDETSAAVCVNGRILSNIVVSQSVHELYGGVVPELASRAHQFHIIPVVDRSLMSAGIEKNRLNAMAYTQGPGLMGSLLVGASFAKSMAASLGIPVMGINHMQAHVLSLFIEKPSPDFPFICLTVSGGHTQVVRVNDYLSMTLLGETTDDAAGEAFDKTAKILGLPYPGGHLIDQFAKQGDPYRFAFPDTDMKGFDFSFSGIKTAVLYFIRDQVQQNPDFIRDNLADICASVQYRIVRMLVTKLEKAAKSTGIKSIAIAGGVSVNTFLRESVNETAHKNNWKFYYPEAQYCTDNAAMIAITGYYKFLQKDFSEYSSSPEARLKL